MMGRRQKQIYEFGHYQLDAADCRATELPDNHNGRRTRRRKRKPLRPTEA
jgi:hypothetical protein